MIDWIVLGKGVGVHPESTHLKWIVWRNGLQTMEGLITRKELAEQFRVTLDDPEAKWVSKLVEAGFVEAVLREYLERTSANPDEVLSLRLFKECPHYKKAMLLAKSGAVRHNWADEIVRFYRHNCCSYDSELKGQPVKGSEWEAVSIKHHNDLMEIMQFYKAHKDEILSCNSKSSILGTHRALANVDHNAVIQEVLKENQNRRIISC